MTLKHFRKLTEREVAAMISACMDAAIEYSQKIGMSGLSEGGSHNIYRAIEDAIILEHKKAKEAYKHRD